MLTKNKDNYCAICEKHCEYAQGFAVCTADQCKVIEKWVRNQEGTSKWQNG